MILPSHRAKPWLTVGLLLLVILSVSYLRYASRAEAVHGGTRTGIAYGILALILVFVLMAFGLRKRAYRSTWGTVDGWLQAHIHLGLLTLVVTVFHAGFRFQDKVATLAAIVLFAVVLSGFLGARLYATLPRRLARKPSDLTEEEISKQLHRLTRAMARIVASRSALFQRRAERLLGNSEQGNAGQDGEQDDGGQDSKGRHGLLESLATEEREPMRQLLVLHRQHQELYQRLRSRKRYKNLLEVWLYLHLPLSIVLLLLIAAHVVAMFYFGAV